MSLLEGGVLMRKAVPSGPRTLHVACRCWCGSGPAWAACGKVDRARARALVMLGNVAACGAYTGLAGSLLSKVAAVSLVMAAPRKHNTCHDTDPKQGTYLAQ